MSRTTKGAHTRPYAWPYYNNDFDKFVRDEYWFYRSYEKKYGDLSVEQAFKRYLGRLRAEQRDLFNPPAWYRRHKNQKYRCKTEHELIRAMKRAEEEVLIITPFRRNAGWDWW